MQQELYDVVVVGAGIVGCSVSYHLTKAGLKVALVDKGGVAGEASQAAAGVGLRLGGKSARACELAPCELHGRCAHP